MNLLDRAKALLLAKSALAVVPLAVAIVASSAGAAPILPSSTPACSADSPDHIYECSASGANTPGGGGTFFGGSSVFGSGSSVSFIVGQSGVMNENAVGSVPVTYSFQVNFDDIVDFAQYPIQLRISQAGGQTFSQSITRATISSYADFTGFLILPDVNLVAGLTTTTSIIIPVPRGNGTARLVFPNNGFITFGAPFAPEETATPEPASAALLALGVTAAWAVRKTRQ